MLFMPVVVLVACHANATTRLSAKICTLETSPVFGGLNSTGSEKFKPPLLLIERKRWFIVSILPSHEMYMVRPSDAALISLAFPSVELLRISFLICSYSLPCKNLTVVLAVVEEEIEL